jgi:succinoglycan biosynthesis transport protein ExoP
VKTETVTAGQELRSGLRKIWRHKVLVAGFMAAGLGASALIHDQAIPRYEAESQVVLGIRSMPIVKSDPIASTSPSQPGVLRTEMDIITSRAMAESVVRRLSAADKRELSESSGKRSSWQRMSAMLTEKLETLIPDRAPKAPDASVAAGTAGADGLEVGTLTMPQLVDAVMAGVSATNDGQSFTIHIGFGSPDPQLAATMANLYATAYIENQLDAKAEAAERASLWLTGRLVELRRNLEASETTAQNFRHSADIVEDKQGTVTSQQLSEVNSQLIQARTERLDIESRLSTMRSILAGGGDISALPEAASSPVISGLRERIAELQRKQSENQSLYTDSYPVDKSIEVDAAALKSQLEAELKRLIDGMANTLKTARSREQALSGELALLKQRSGEGSDAEVQLRLLERESDANRAVYEAYLNRLKETTEQSKLQEPDSYLISSAVPPNRPSYPRTAPIFLLGAMFGAFAGVIVALLREMFDHRLHTVEQVEELTGLRVLSLMPSLPYARLFKPENHVLRKPGSLFSEALRTTRAAIALSHNGGRSRVILVTSSIPGEGKTAFCLSLARALAVDNHKVLLIDSDLRRPCVAKAFGAAIENSLADILSGAKELQQAVRVDRKSGAHYIGAKNDVSNPHDLLTSDRMVSLIAEARQNYDVVIIDAPPIMMVADAALIAGLADHCLFFIRWGSTARDYVTHALRRLELYQVTVSGVILSRVDTRRHAAFAAGEGYYRSYAMPAARGRQLRKMAPEPREIRRPDTLALTNDDSAGSSSLRLPAY